MPDRAELMEAALDGYPEGVALLDQEGRVVYWNRTAEEITGFPSLEIVARRVPWVLEPILTPDEDDNAREGVRAQRGRFVHAQDRQGRHWSAMVRGRILRNDMGERIGQAIIFRPAERETLPHGGVSAESEAEWAQTQLEERVEEVFEDFSRRGAALGVLWIAVDQAPELRKTHGGRACEAMLERVGHTIEHGLRPLEEIGRWGDDEFLVLAHESTPALLAARAQVLAGLARTADFRWWGDRISLTVSVGAAQAVWGEELTQLLERAQAAMYTSIHAGGNHTTLAPGGRACLPS